MKKYIVAGAVALVLLLTCCVDGSPVDPSMCEVYADSLPVIVSGEVLLNCPALPIRTGVPK